MEDRDTPPADYQKGFNEGYLIAEHMPDLAEKLISTNSDSLRITGLKDGIEQLKKEKTKEAYPKWLKKDRLSSLDKKDDLTKDKDDPDKD